MGVRGPRQGSKQLKTIRKEAVAAEIRNRVMQHADPLFQAQLCKAVGSIRIFRVDEVEDEKGNIKKEHVLVTDADEQKRVLDGVDGAGAGKVGESYYFVTEIPPDNKAIDSMLDRTFGKAPVSVSLSVENDLVADAKALVAILIEEEQMAPEKAIRLTAERYRLPENVIDITAVVSDASN